ncbi:deoxynucleoside triphosphate triphosphohydrolase SAMHD1-like [Ptychodera flava]|uniref:deoxynucleoside triphosphate triphosphohydrolase SAMHD1-like n=1 Tax=Ptychodera flava TaxID=63121 RepID=UPI003969C1EB
MVRYVEWKTGRGFSQGSNHERCLKRVNTTTITVKANIRTWEYKQCKAFLQYSRTEEQFVSSSEVTETERIPIRMRRATKVIQDPIHGTIELDPVYMTIIDTPEFQRLRDIKKLGTVNFVYPGSVHTRFEHSIGTCYLALKLVRYLKENYQNTLGITKEEELCVGLAALCLDLGRGPFSNEEKIIPALKITGHDEFTHTLASVKIFDLMVKKYKLQEVFKTYGYQMMDIEFHLVKEMIYGPLQFGNEYLKADSYQATSPYRYFLYEIVSNRRNGIDASEWDGLARDSYHLGIVHGNSMHERFIKFARVLQVPSKTEQRKQICFRDKEAPSACEMLRARYRQRGLTTFHSVKIGIDIMIADAIVAAAPYLKRRKENGEAVGMSEILKDMDAYMTLDDTIYTEILKSHDDDKLMEARLILQRIQKRELYKLVCKVEFPANLTKQDIRQEDIITSHANDGSLKEDDLRLMIVNMDYGVGDKNPFDDMLFYSKDDAAPRYALPDEISHLIPKTFQERRLFVYVTDYNKNDIATRCVEEWARESGLIKPPQPQIPGTLQYTGSEDQVPLQTGIKRQVEESYDDETISKIGKFD